MIQILQAIRRHPIPKLTLKNTCTIPICRRKVLKVKIIKF